MIIGIGDSLTFGSIGYSYIDFLPNKVINKGINGNPILGCQQQLGKLLYKNKYRNADTFVVQIGTNDIFLPELKKVSLYWKICNTLRPFVFGYHYCFDSKEFEEVYSGILNMLNKENKKIILIGLPKTELANCSVNRLLKQRNFLIQKLANQYNAKFIDLYNLMEQIEVAESEGYKWGKSNIMRFIDGIVFLIFPPMKDVFSRIRGLNLTVDGLHFNSKTAKILAKAIEQEV